MHTVATRLENYQVTENHHVALITAMTSEDIISGYKGTLDFYVHRGLNCVRKWPQSPGHNRSPAVMTGWTAFSYAAAEWKHLSPAVQQAYNQYSTNSGLTGRDLFMRAYIRGLYYYPTP